MFSFNRKNTLSLSRTNEFIDVELKKRIAYEVNPDRRFREGL